MLKKNIELKQAKVNDCVQKMQTASSFIIFEYTSIDASEMSALRKAIVKADGKLIVLKNNILNRSLQQCNINDFQTLKKQNAIAFAFKDEIAVLKHVEKATTENKAMKIKGSIINRQFYDEAKTIAIAKLPSRNEMYSMLLSCLTAPIRNLLYGLKAVSELNNN